MLFPFGLTTVYDNINNDELTDIRRIVNSVEESWIIKNEAKDMLPGTLGVNDTIRGGKSLTRGYL